MSSALFRLLASEPAKPELLKYWQDQAQNGDVFSLCCLGYYCSPDGPSPDPQKALGFWQAAAAKDEPFALFSLGSA
jgi:hypothetical protein